MKICAAVIILSSVFPTLYGFADIARFGLHGVRIMSTFQHPNVFAFYLVLVLAVSIMALLSPAIRLAFLTRVALAGYAVVVLALIALTGTRNAWAGCILLFAAYGLMLNRKSLVLIVLGGVVAFFLPPVQDRLADLFAPARYVSSVISANSYQWRLNVWQQGLSYMKPSEYFMGKGLDSFLYYSREFTHFLQDVGAHSVYVQTFFEMGIVGLVVAAWTFIRLFFVLGARFRANRVEAVLTVTIALMFLMFCFADNMYYYLVFNWYFAFVMGTACAIRLGEKAQRKKAQQSNQPAMPAMPSGASVSFA